LALISRLVYRRSGYNFAEHLVVSTYYMAQLLLFNLGYSILTAIAPAWEGSTLLNNMLGLLLLGYAWWLHIPTFQPRGGWKIFSPLLFSVIMLFALGVFYGLGAEFLLSLGQPE